MKLSYPRFLTFISSVVIFCASSRADIPVPDEPGVVTYNPVVKIAQGNQPFSDTYELLISMPATLPPGVPIPVNLTIESLTRPPGVSPATALSYVTLSTSSLTVTQLPPIPQLPPLPPFLLPPPPVGSVMITVNVPLGSVAGAYSWKVATSDWPESVGPIIDLGGLINGLFIAPGEIDATPPAITLNSPVNGTVYTYFPASGNPVTVPVDFAASVGTNGQPIRGLTAFINGSPVSFLASGLNTLSATGVGSVQLTAPGLYTISANATNLNGTSTASSDITVVVSAPPPTITASSPAGNSNFSFTLGGAGATVPLSFVADSVYGNVTSLAATLDGTPVALGLSGVGSATTASGSASLTVAAPGSHSLVLSAANDFGAATPVTIPFTVTGVTPAPTVAILTPANGANFTRVAGAPPTVVNFSFEGGTTYGVVTSVNVTLDGAPLAATVNGLNTASVTGSGALSFSAGGSHTLNVTLSNGGATASASTSFTVTQTQPQADCNLIWLPPISLNKTIEGGSTLPIKFTLRCAGKFERHTSLLIAIYEVFPNGSHSTPTVYPYGSGGNPNPPDYAIEGKAYHLNFKTAKGAHQYQVEVYLPVSGTMQLLGSKEVNTRKKGKGGGSGHGGHDDDDDDHGHHGDDNDHDGHSGGDCDDDRDGHH